MRPILILAALLFIAQPANADLYKWVDENGVTHYSNTPVLKKSDKHVEKHEEFGGQPRYTPHQKGSRNVKSKRLTKAKYDAIRNGMSYADVVRIIGYDGENLATNHLDGIPGVMKSVTTKMYSWENSDGSNMNAMFQNDRLVSKAQYGLR
jgi:hypothetical protein